MEVGFSPDWSTFKLDFRQAIETREETPKELCRVLFD